GRIARRRPNATLKGVVIHNDAGSIYATAAQYVNALPVMSPTQLANGFAHYYIDRNTIARVQDTFSAAWHRGNPERNLNYVGYEECQ
ncbi:peptidoglycan recognition protein family protein, partial [Enterococcus faecalis]|uniref:peptidoglycan recognition protein family protein n=1 Tax=Enterococcus faecalis TaxID=1351 RepID=UPI003D6C1678